LVGLLDLISKITILTTGTMIGTTTTTAMFGAMTTATTTMTIMIGIGKTTLGGDRAATNQLTTP
jgi:hypothetical protein